MPHPKHETPITSARDELMLMFAFRYALGRRTSAPSEVADVLFRKWHELSTNMKTAIRKEIHDAISAGRAGEALDVRTWKRVLTFPIMKE